MLPLPVQEAYSGVYRFERRKRVHTFFDCPYVGISTLLTEFTALITAAIAAHSRCIFCHYQSPFFIIVALRENPFIGYSNERYPFSSSFEIRLLSTSFDTSYIPISFAEIAFT